MQLLDLHAKGTRVTAGGVQRPVAGVRPRRVRPAVKLAVNAAWSSGTAEHQHHCGPVAHAHHCLYNAVCCGECTQHQCVGSLIVNRVLCPGAHAPPPQQQQQHMPPLQQRTPAPSNGGTALQPAGPQSVLSAVGPAVKTARVRFWLKFHVDYGQSIRVIGGAQPLGECMSDICDQPNIAKNTCILDEQTQHVPPALLMAVILYNLPL